MTPSIFVEQTGGGLVPMTPESYEAEAVLQKLLADYPDLLVAESETGERAYLLVRREAGIPDKESGADRWSIDHLFLDHEGVPTLVEVKRSTDGRIRREVVGQMLDYAANAVLYWPLDRIMEDFNATCAARGEDPDEVLEGHLGGSDLSQSDFWQRVQTNLSAKRIRMLFVADRIPEELQRIVQFLNEQMTSSDVLAVEIKQYASESGLRTFVTNVIGDTPAAALAKSGGRELGPKGKLYQEFWPPLMKMLQEQIPGWLGSAKGVPSRHVLRLPSGRSGIWYGLSFTQERHLQVILYLRNRDSKAPHPFDLLKVKQASIEEAFGQPLVWDKVEDRKRAHILIRRAGEADVDRTDDWDEYRAWLVGTALKFRNALQPAIESISMQTSAPP